VPFERRVPVGFFETLGEDERAAVAAAARGAGRQLLGATLDQLNGARRDEAEQRARAEDARRQKRQREEDLPAVLARVNAASAAALSNRRGALLLPPPQVSDFELEQIARAGARPAEVAACAATGTAATSLLLASYEQTPFAQRGAGGATPSLAHGGAQPPALSRAEWVQREAATLAALAKAPTPLAGGESVAIALGDFGGVTPQLQRGAAGGATPGGASLAGATPAARARAGAAPTPSRDALGINPAGGGGGGGATPFAQTPSATPSRAAAADDFAGGGPLVPRGAGGGGGGAAGGGRKGAGSALAQQLRALPAPQNEYALELPSLPAPMDEDDDEAGALAGRVEDMDVRARARTRSAATAARAGLCGAHRRARALTPLSALPTASLRRRLAPRRTARTGWASRARPPPPPRASS
jgi:pre-mRNA-splicing factor CDC5/CEF1